MDADKINEIKMNLTFFRDMLVGWDFSSIEIDNSVEFGMTYFLDHLIKDVEALAST